MNFKKLIIGAIAGGIAFFFLGWLIYGNLLMDFMTKNHGLPEPTWVHRREPLMLYLVIGNFISGLLLAYIFIKANVNSLAKGITVGGTVGLLMSAGYDCMAYALTTLMNAKAVVIDVAAAVVITGMVGAIMGAIFNRLNKS